MNFLPLTLPTLADNLALDEALLLEAEAGRMGEVLRIWEFTAPVVVLGAACIHDEDIRAEACRRDGVVIGRRSSGGGTVLLGNGCLCFSLILSYDRDERLGEIRSSYAFILQQVADVLALPGIERHGTSDLSLGRRKFSGNSQQRKRGHLLHHGTLLYAFDIARIADYLHMPQRQPEYRQGRDHADFLINLPLGKEEISSRLQMIWGAKDTLREWPRSEVDRLVRQKYLTKDWIHRR